MNYLAKIIAYYCIHYPYRDELSDARLTKMVYLADWFSSLSSGKQLTHIRWYFNHYGPYVDDVIDAVQASSRFFQINTEYNYYGNSKKLISYKGHESLIQLDSFTIHILNTVVEETKHMYFNEFIDFVYSTYPIAKNDRYAYLNLEELARECQSRNR